MSLNNTINNSTTGGIVGSLTGHPILGTVAGALSSSYNSLKNKFSAPRPQKAVETTQPAKNITDTGNSKKTWDSTGGNTGMTTGSLSSTYNQATNPSISNLYNSSLKYGSGGVTDPSIYTQSSERLARDTNQALADAALSPDQTRSYFEGRTGMIQDLASKRAANLSSVMDQNRQQQQLGLAGVKQAFDIAQPRTISPTDMVYNALQSPDQINQQNLSSGRGRVFNSGVINAQAGLGGRSVELGQAQNIVSGVKNLLGNDNPTAINKINQFIADIKNNVSSPSRAQFEATLGGLAQAIAPYNPTLADSLTGENLKNAKGDAILSAINQAQQIIQVQQQSVGGGQNTPSGTNGGYAEAW